MEKFQNKKTTGWKFSAFKNGIRTQVNLKVFSDKGYIFVAPNESFIEILCKESQKIDVS